MAIIPPSKPKASRSRVIAAAQKQWAGDNPGKDLPSLFVLAVRAYYDASIAPAGNNIGDYDDAFFVVTPQGMTAWNGNTDPSRYGWNPGAEKYMARLKPGCYKMRRWKHKGQYWAFGQAGVPVTVERIKQDGAIAMTEAGSFGINLHRGGERGTSSEGCLTVPPEQWTRFQSTLQFAADSLEGGVFDVILYEGPIV